MAMLRHQLQIVIIIIIIIFVIIIIIVIIIQAHETYSKAEILFAKPSCG